ncbi:RNA polymerase factor sigma-54 [Marivibrio halodurans]|uniref:RNA polymerase sigma-54 factor n=1 Tax=Marivibrio halodurans TaxID=2039722 RepID=A0A8J7S3D9_9PROT|nr:RNA polymerase factor sigma-54 [Marivibrio halodurans]MBP5857969.1 RNA polymerase factor sigma-54 [Marivibrio halodurans]
MSLTARLDLRQSQQLVMTPQLQQAIKLLQFSSVELAAFVEEELERNPLLERDEGQREAADERLRAEDSDRHAPSSTTDERRDSAEMLSADGAQGIDDRALDADYDGTYEGDIAGPGADGGQDRGEAGLSLTGPGMGGGGGGFDDDPRGFEETLAGPESLQDRLVTQLHLDTAEPAARMIGLYLIDSLDPSGYLTIDLDEVVDALGADRATVEAVLARLQGFEPAGLFARSLAECLKLQLIEKNRFDPAMAALLDNLDLLARGERAKLMKLCGVDAEDLTEMAAELRALDPKPGLTHGFEPAEPVIPDVLMRRGPKGDWIIELNPDTLPKVLVNERFYAEIAGTARERRDKEYLSERLQTANWLVKSLHQRATTILKVSSELVRQQDAFFRHGVAHLKPLVLRDIADAIEMHESTVSRVTSNKYIASPRGLFELKYFFTTRIAGTEGDQSHSAESVRHRIRALIDAETADSVLSDDKLVEMLRGEGVDIARRTVAKYREAMRIPSSVQRRRRKKAAI